MYEQHFDSFLKGLQDTSKLAFGKTGGLHTVKFTGLCGTHQYSSNPRPYVQELYFIIQLTELFHVTKLSCKIPHLLLGVGIIKPKTRKPNRTVLTDLSIYLVVRFFVRWEILRLLGVLFLFGYQCLETEQSEQTDMQDNPCNTLFSKVQQFGGTTYFLVHNTFHISCIFLLNYVYQFA